MTKEQEYMDLQRKSILLDDAVKRCVWRGHFDMAGIWRDKRESVDRKIVEVMAHPRNL